MRFNRNIIQNIFDTALWDRLVFQVRRDVQTLGDDNALSFSLDERISSVDLNSIGLIHVYDYNTRKTDETTVVSGNLSVAADTNVYAMDEDGDEYLVDTETLDMNYDFSFEERDGKYSRLELDWLDNPHWM